MAERMRKATDQALANATTRTPDINGHATQEAMVNCILEALG
jgi:isocitrate/isopropylmalate dehydrogenase